MRKLNQNLWIIEYPYYQICNNCQCSNWRIFLDFSIKHKNHQSLRFFNNRSIDISQAWRATCKYEKQVYRIEIRLVSHKILLLTGWTCHRRLEDSFRYLFKVDHDGIIHFVARLVCFSLLRTMKVIFFVLRVGAGKVCLCSFSL